MKRFCAISPEICKKLREIKKIIRIESEINQINANTIKPEELEKKFVLSEKLGDSYCTIGLYELGLNSYFRQVKI